MEASKVRLLLLCRLQTCQEDHKVYSLTKNQHIWRPWLTRSNHKWEEMLQSWGHQWRCKTAKSWFKATLQTTYKRSTPTSKWIVLNESFSKRTSRNSCFMRQLIPTAKQHLRSLNSNRAVASTHNVPCMGSTRIIMAHMVMVPTVNQPNRPLTSHNLLPSS
jgi:hypothetical protein